MPRSSAAVAFELADHQDGCVTQSQLVAGGLTAKEIAGLRAKEIVIPALRGIYAVGTRRLSARQLQVCALLRASAGGGLSHRTACEVRELLRPRPSVVEVASLRRGLLPQVRPLLPMRDTGRPGLIVTARITFPPDAPEMIGGLHTLPLPRALVDLAGRHGLGETRRAWREADFRGLLNPEELASEVAREARRAGVVALRRVWDEEGLVGHGNDLRSRNERRFLRMLASAGLPMPLTNHVVLLGGRRYRFDFYWVKERVAVELDGDGHRRRFAAENDIARDIDARNAGIELLRFDADVAYARTAWCISQIEPLLAARGLSAAA